MKHKAYFLILVVSLILTFAVAPLRMFQLFENPPLYLGTLIRGVIFWGVTVYFLVKYSSIVKPYKIVLLVLLADLLPDIIVRVFMGHFIIALPSFPDTFLQIIVVLSGWWYARLNNIGKVTLAIVNLLVCAAISSYGFVVWNELDFVKDSRFDKLEVVEILKQADSSLLSDSITTYFQNKNLIVYVGGDNDEANEIGLSFLQKVQDEFKGNNEVAVLSLICLDKLEDRNQKTQFSKETKFPIVYIDKDKSCLDSSALYQWYVIDRNGVIRVREKVHFLGNNDNRKEQNELQFLKKLMAWLD